MLWTDARTFLLQISSWWSRASVSLAEESWCSYSLSCPSSHWYVLSEHVLFFGRARSEGWPHHGHTFSICLCPLSFWLTLPRQVLSTSWCCPSRPCMVFLAFVHLALFLALSLFPGNSLVSSWCDRSMLTSLLWQWSNSSIFTPALLRTHSFVFFAVRETRRIFLSPFISKASWCVSSFFQSVQLSQPYIATGHTSVFISRIFVDIGMLWIFHSSCNDAPIACPLFSLVQNEHVTVTIQYSVVVYMHVFLQQQQHTNFLTINPL